MHRLLIVSLFLFPAGMLSVCAQNACTALGQNPGTAFPVCGSDTFTQSSVPVCLNGNVPAPTCGGGYQAINPYWYKFTCFTSGTLGLLINPNNAGDDYDWQLYDITGQSPDAVFSQADLVIASNWSGVTGNTGTAVNATAYYECGSTSLPATGPPPFSKMPDLVQGHNYLLLISHFSGDSQSGYKLSFNGGTASITDTVPPALQAVQPVCDGSTITVVLNKKMTCSSLASDGSDFTVSPAVATVVAASGDSCSSGFDMDTLTLTLSGGLPPGHYTLTMKNGTDGNTILDNCGTPIPVGASLPFTMVALQPTPLDSLTPPGCAPDLLQLVFPKKIQCSSISPDGSDFKVTGPSPVTVTGATAQCGADGESNTILVQLSAPIVNGGTYHITLANGTDGNTIIDQCGLPSTVGQTLPFTLKDTVSADFIDQLFEGCVSDTIAFTYPEKNGVDQWQWVFDQTDTVRAQNPPERIYSVFGQKTAQLIVSNGLCSDTANVIITLDNAINAAFEAPNILCPTDAATFMNNSTGSTINSWNWDFGDGTGTNIQNPSSHLYPQTGIETKYAVSLVVGNGSCYDTTVQLIDVLRSCYIAVPSAFTPNGDGLNDYLYPLNAYKADNLDFKVFNRYGQLVFESRVWTQKWDGTVGGHPEPAGAFVWMLQYTDRDTGKKVFQKGTSLLIR